MIARFVCMLSRTSHHNGILLRPCPPLQKQNYLSMMQTSRLFSAVLPGPQMAPCSHALLEFKFHRRSVCSLCICSRGAFGHDQWLSAQHYPNLHVPCDSVLSFMHYETRELFTPPLQSQVWLHHLQMHQYQMHSHCQQLRHNRVALHHKASCRPTLARAKTQHHPLLHIQ